MDDVGAESRAQARPSGDREVEIVAEDPGRVTRAPSDALRLATAVVTTAVVVVVGLVFGNAVVAFTSDLLRGLDAFPSWLVTTIVVLAQLASVAIVAGVVLTAIRLRSGLLVATTVAAAAAAAALAAGLSSLLEAEGEALTQLQPADAWYAESSWTAVGLAVLAAAVATVGPWVSRGWRRAGWAGVACVAVVHFATNPVAFETLAALLAGWLAGSLTTFVAGAPSQRPSARAIAEGLDAVGVPLRRIEQASVDARGSTPYFATATDGSKLFVKALGDDERSADLMFRIYRRVQPRDLGDEKAFSTLRRAVEHEALVALAARDVGVRTPRLVAFASAEPHGFALAYEAIAGRSLDRLAPEELTDEVLDGVWTQLALLRTHRTAHRDLRLANVFLADDGIAWLIDFGFSELAASDLLLATDLAELLASSSAVVGPERAVAAGVRGVGGPAVTSALPRLRLPMLSGATRTALKAEPQVLDELRAAVTRAGS
jgi:undecaprenyl-diphosphatase